MPPTLCLYPKDVAELTGRSYYVAKRLVRQAANNPPGALVTVQDSAASPASTAAEAFDALNRRSA